MKQGRSRAATRRTILVLLASMVLLTLLNAVAAAVAPPFPERPRGVHLVDDAELINRLPEQGLDVGLQAYQERAGVDIAVFIQTKPGANEREEADADAAALLREWRVGGAEENGLAMVWEMDREATRAVVGIAVGDGLAAMAEGTDLAAVMRAAMSDALRSDDWVQALNQGVFALTAVIPGPTTTPGSSPPPQPGPTTGPLVPDLPSAPAGPPYPDAIPGVSVYDYAGVLAPSTRQRAASTIAGIEERTGAEIIVFTQVKPESDTPEEAERDAIALIDQYGVGRAGFDDGLAILFDLDDSLCHGQVQLYAAPGYRASYLTNEDRQRIFEQDMLPHLRDGRCDLSGALESGLASIDAATTAERASQLQLARQVDAATGLVLAPLALIGLIAWAGWSWIRYGRDPQYLDDPSIHMPAPPPGLSPAAATVVLDGRATQHAVTTALIDEAGRGELRFRQPGADGRVSLDLLEPDTADTRVLRNRSVPEGAPERRLREHLRQLREGPGTLSADQLTKLSPDIARFKEQLEDHVVAAGWFREAPGDARDRWSLRGGIVLVVGVVAIIIAARLPSSGLLLLAGALIAASIAILIIARVMPQRTMSGAMVHAWLAAYRRTLERTLAGARSMDEVVSSHALPWVETPDQAVVWGFALGLHHEVEDVLERSVELAREVGQTGGRAPWVPAWYVPLSGASGSSHGGASGGLFSSSAIPNFGTMTAALATIGVAASSGSSSGGGGGFSGGGSGGGGGGAGGGF